MPPAPAPTTQTATIAAPSAARALLSSPMDDFDPAEREAAVAKIKELVGQNKVRYGWSVGQSVEGMGSGWGWVGRMNTRSRSDSF